LFLIAIYKFRRLLKANMARKNRLLLLLAVVLLRRPTLAAPTLRRHFTLHDCFSSFRFYAFFFFSSSAISKCSKQESQAG